MPRVIRAGVAFFLLLLSNEKSCAELPPDAQDGVKRGLIVAKEQEWEIAVLATFRTPTLWLIAG